MPRPQEPLRITLTRTIAIAMIVAAALSPWLGGIHRWPTLTLLGLWPSLGGHFVEVAFLNILRPRLPAARPVKFAARIALWFLAGIALAQAMRITATALASPAR
ncbi:MAG: hypothetical protein ABI995_04620 [Acidobacteriota bacterium]